MTDPVGTTKKSSGIARAEIERLCLLYALAEEDGAMSRVTARLALSPELEAAVTEAALTLVATGWVEPIDARLCVTDAGRDHLRTRLAALGV